MKAQSQHALKWDKKARSQAREAGSLLGGPGAHLPQLQSLGHSLQALLASALHGQRELHKLVIEQLDPGNQAALAGHRVAPGAF